MPPVTGRGARQAAAVYALRDLALFRTYAPPEDTYTSDKVVLVLTDKLCQFPSFTG